MLLKGVDLEIPRSEEFSASSGYIYMNVKPDGPYIFLYFPSCLGKAAHSVLTVPFLALRLFLR